MGNAIWEGKRSSWLQVAQEPHPEGVRVLVVAKKSRNGDGAKGDRKVEG